MRWQLSNSLDSAWKARLQASEMMTDRAAIPTPRTPCNDCGTGGMQHRANALTGQPQWGLPAVDPRFAPKPFAHPMPAEAYFSPREIAASIERHYGSKHLDLHQRAEKAVVKASYAMLAALSGKGTADLVQILGGDTADNRKLAFTIKRLAGALQQQPVDANKVRALAERGQWQMVPMIANNKQERAQVARYLKWAHNIGKPGSTPYHGQGPFGSAVANHAPGAAVVTPGQFSAGSPSASGRKALDAARSQLGVREATGNNDGIPSKRYMDGRKEPWCANFVSWAFRQTGHPLPGNQRSLASVQYMEDQMKKAGKFHRGTPAAGDVIFFKNRGGSDSGPGRHVGIVEKVENGYVYTIEGNSSNGVNRRKYKLDNGRIAGYGRN